MIRYKYEINMNQYYYTREYGIRDLMTGKYLFVIPIQF